MELPTDKNLKPYGQFQIWKIYLSCCVKLCAWTHETMILVLSWDAHNETTCFRCHQESLREGLDCTQNEVNFNEHEVNKKVVCN